ncbi:hypothetical protein KJ870_03950 [bacterium]|jgi:hypothetical protein|nr:hypothetical protein [bacterium]MBU1434071.1 hypothetical protein [bacterium]
MRIVLIVILIDLLIFTLGSLYVTDPSVLHYKNNPNSSDHFGYEWKLEKKH